MHDWFELTRPSFRATIETSRLILVPIRQVRLGAREVRETLDARSRRRVTVIDLSVDVKPGWQELVVQPLTPLGASAEEVLLDWATATGYRRAWLADRVVELADGPPELKAASVECPGCGVTWREQAPDFWSGVWTRGAFPSRCGLCGGLMPQWQVEPIAAAAEKVTIQRRWVQGDGAG